MKQVTNSLPYRGWRALLWPIDRHEARKIVPMLLILVSLCVSYNIIRNVKDVLVLTAKDSGAQVIPFIKVWALLPATILAMWGFSFLSRFLSREKLFYLVMSGFLSFFIFFAFVVYPYREQLHLYHTAEMLLRILPSGLEGGVRMIQYWSFTLFYLVTELWVIFPISLLFWGFANEVTRLEEGKRFYGVLNLGGNSSALMAGGLTVGISKWMDGSWTWLGSTSWEQQIAFLTLLVTALTLIAMGLYRILHRQPQTITPVEGESTKPAKVQLKLIESIKCLAASRQLLFIGVLVCGYNLAFNLFEVLWKSQLTQRYPDPEQLMDYVNHVTLALGVLSAIFSLFISLLLCRKGWTFTALITPIIMLVGSLAFFFCLFGQQLAHNEGWLFLGFSPLTLTVFFGALQNCLSKATKYSLFDATKEFAFLPLSPEERWKGKAAIDGLGISISKSGSSLTYQLLLFCCGSLQRAAPLVGGILFAIYAAWIVAVVGIGRLLQKHGAEDAFKERYGYKGVTEHKAISS